MIRPTVSAQSMGGHGNVAVPLGWRERAVPLARDENASPEAVAAWRLTGARPIGEATAARRLTLVEHAELEHAELEHAELEHAELEPAELEHAELEHAEAQFAELESSGVEFADLEFAVIDLETTGWSPGAAAIMEIAAVRVRGGRRHGEYGSLVNPGVPVPPGIENLTGISDWMLAAAPKLPAVLPGLLDFAGGCILVAHNAPFDIGFLRAASAECGLAWPRFTVLDTVMLARQLMDPDEVPDCKLGTLAGFFRARTTPSHRALADARATADVLGWLISRLTHRGVRTLDELRAWPEVVT